jgi:hypothetical protein
METKEGAMGNRDWFVHGYSEKNGDIAFVVQAVDAADALGKVAALVGMKLVECRGDHYLAAYPDMTAKDIAKELDSNFGSPRRSYSVSAVPLKRNENLM